MPFPALASALPYYDYYRSEQMPVNFVQALRDCFGAHTYERTDREGHFHTSGSRSKGDRKMAKYKVLVTARSFGTADSKALDLLAAKRL